MCRDLTAFGPRLSLLMVLAVAPWLSGCGSGEEVEAPSAEHSHADHAHDAAPVEVAEPAAEEGAMITLPLRWEQQFLSGSDSNAARGVVVDEEGGSYVAGDVGHASTWQLRYLDSDGVELWKFDPTDVAVTLPYGLVRSPLGGVVGAGTSFAKGPHSVVIAVSRDGKELWRKIGGGHIVRALATDEEGNLYLAGEADGRWQVFSLTPTGEERWTYRGARGSAWALAAHESGGLVVAGTSKRRWRAIGLDPGGERIWKRELSESYRPINNGGRSVLALADGGSIVGGMVTERALTLHVTRLDSAGEVIWEYLDRSAPGGVGRALLLGSDGKLLVGGNLGGDMLISRLSLDGKLIWRFRHDGGGKLQNPDMVHGMSHHPSGDLLLVGAVHTQPATPPHRGAVSWRIARYGLPD